MALTIPHPHLHHPHTTVENLMLWMAGAAVAASIALGAFLVLDNNAASVAPAQLDSVSEISRSLAEAEATVVPQGPTAAEIIRQEIDKAQSALGTQVTTGPSAAEIIQQEIDKSRPVTNPSAAQIIQQEIDKALASHQ